MIIDGIKIRNDLHRMLTQAEIDLEMWQAMRHAQSSEDVLLMFNRGYGRFYIAAENALLNSMIKLLYAVFEVNKKSVNFWRLKDSLLSIANPSQIFELDNTYASIKHLWKKISIIRNEVVGQQSLERTTAESHEKAGLTVKHAGRMIEACQDLLYRIARDFYDTHVVFNIKSTESFDKLISDLRAWKNSKRL